MTYNWREDNTWIIPEILRKQVEHLESLEPNWDSYGAPVISEAALNAAVMVFRDTWQLTPCSNGGVQIDWPNAEITFLPDGLQEFDETKAARSYREKASCGHPLNFQIGDDHGNFTCTVCRMERAERKGLPDAT